MLVGLSLIVPVLIVTATGHAQRRSLLDRALHRYQQGEFEEALTLLEQQEVEQGLSREVLIRVFELEALAHFALDHSDDVDQALLRLATLAPGHVLVADAPPAVQSAFGDAKRRAGAGLSLALRTRPEGAGAVLVAQVENDVAGLSASVRLSTRAAGESWRSTNAMRTELEGPSVQYYGEILGDTGVVLATEGTAAEPRVWFGAVEGRERARASRPSAWVWVGITAAVAAVAGGAVAIALVAKGDTRTDVESPAIDFGP